MRSEYVNMRSFLIQHSAITNNILLVASLLAEATGLPPPYKFQVVLAHDRIHISDGCYYVHAKVSNFVPTDQCQLKTISVSPPIYVEEGKRLIISSAIFIDGVPRSQVEYRDLKELLKKSASPPAPPPQKCRRITQPSAAPITQFTTASSLTPSTFASPGFNFTTPAYPAQPSEDGELLKKVIHILTKINNAYPNILIMQEFGPLPTLPPDPRAPYHRKRP